MRKQLSFLFLFLASLVAAQSAHAVAICNGVAAASNLVTNCGFETGTFAGWSGTVLTDPLANSGVDGSEPYTGSFGAFFGPEAPDTLFENLSTTVGTTYTIQFAVAQDGTPYPPNYVNSLIASFGGTNLLTLTNVPVEGYTLYMATATATATTTQLLFTAEDQDSTFDLDSVSVKANSVTPPAATPEPSSLILLGTGVAGLAGAARRRFRR